MQQGEKHAPFRVTLVALLISILVCCGSNAQSREQPVYCYPPSVTAVAPGQVLNGKLCRVPWAAPVRVGFVPSVRLCRRTPCHVNGQLALRFRAAAETGSGDCIGAIRLRDRSQPARR